MTNSREILRSMPDSFVLALTLLTLGTGVGCLGDDLRNPNLGGPPCLAVASGVAFCLASHALLLLRRAAATLTDIAVLTGGGTLGIGAVAVAAWPAPEWMLAGGAATESALSLLAADE